MKSAAILYIAIGDYVCFWKSFYISLERYFLPNTKKEYYVFTDNTHIYADERKDVHVIYQENLGWPGNTLMRFSFFNSISEELKRHDYIFFMNANILCCQMVSEEEFLPDKEDYVFVLHHAFVGADNKDYPYDRNPESEAYIPYGKGRYYITGGINGGKAGAFLKLSKEIDEMTQRDNQKGVVALWHDESMINKYALKETNYRILSPSYFYPELVGSIQLNVERKMVARDKRKYFDVSDLKKDESLAVNNPKKQLMDAYYHRLYHKWLLLKALGISCIEILDEYEHIAIYSYRNAGEVLICEIENAGKGDKISCILDPEPQKYHGKYEVCKPYEMKDNIDLIIVTEAYNYGRILSDMSVVSGIPIVSLEDILNKLLIKYDIKIKSNIW